MCANSSMAPSNRIVPLLQLNKNLANGLVTVIGRAVCSAILCRLIDVDKRHVAIPSFPLIDRVAVRIVDAQPIVVRDIDEHPIPLVSMHLRRLARLQRKVPDADGFILEEELCPNPFVVSNGYVCIIHVLFPLW